jgi:ribonuclease P protein component
MTAQEGLPKYERICKDNDIQALFDKGEGFSVYPFRVVFLFRHDESRPVTVRLLVSVSKKRFHHAFKRNRVKRLVRETWRRNKAPLYEICERDTISVDVALVYTATVIHSYEELFKKMQKVVHDLAKKYGSSHETYSKTAR